ncbi:MAG: hypothetical protein EBS29_00270 [Chloroflexia bacterium]|nr:hypothetical protein [Chloroflexia bacterium]
MPTVAQVTALALKYLAPLGAEIDEEGDIYVDQDGTICYVSIEEFGEQIKKGNDILVKIYAPMVWDVPRTPALYKWVATEAQTDFLCRVACNENHAGDAKLTDIYLEHGMFGDNMQAEELLSSVVYMISVVNLSYQDIHDTFGGNLE